MLNEGDENKGFSYVFDDGTTLGKECGDLVYNGGRILDSYASVPICSFCSISTHSM